MSRATVIYIAVLLTSAAGVWLILRAGSGLRAPADLSGVWGVGGEDPRVAEILGDTVNIEQSGRFFRLNFAKGLRVDVKLTDETTPEPASGRKLDMLFEGAHWKLSAFGTSTDGPLILRLTGPAKHTFTATRGGPSGAPDAAPDAPAAAAAKLQTADADTDAP